jgi:stalled ribosome rescue protein Dom34
MSSRSSQANAAASPDLFGALEPLNEVLRRSINPHVYTRRQLAKHVKDGNSFVTRVLEQPKLWVYGSEHELAA